MHMHASNAGHRVVQSNNHLQQNHIMLPAPAATVAAALLMAASVVVLLLVAPADGRRCDPTRDVVVKETTGDIQLDGAKKYGVTVYNQAAAAVSGVHLACGYNFRHVDDDVDPRVIVQVAHDDCLLVGGGAIAPGGSVSFAYTSYVRYDMHVLAATCAATVPSSSHI